MLKFLKRFWIILLAIIVILWIIVAIYLQHPMFWANPSWERLARIEQSPNYHDGQFWNLSDTPLMTPDENWENDTSILSWLKWDDNDKRLAPTEDIPSIKTDLKSLSKDENILVWLGHSAYFMILDWKTYLVDPTLVTGSPVWFVNKPFPWTTIYTPEDIPEIDYLIITHDHYDHLDYFTMKEIKDRVWKVVTSLWVWAHLEKRWFDNEDIIEMDWYDESILEDNSKITCLPARHYAWRLFNQNNTLWSSFMLETPTKTIYIWWDSWYDKFFKEFWEKWNIDLAVIENGQYDQQWKYIHMLPDDIVQAIKDLNADNVFTVHNSKYSMANHARDEPLIALDERLQKEWIDSWITPIIGQVVNLDDIDKLSFTKWWDKNFEETVPQIEEEIDEEIIEPEPIETESFVDKDDYNEFLEAIKSSWEQPQRINDYPEKAEENNVLDTEEWAMDSKVIYLKIWNKTFDITLEDNSSTKALVEKLKEWDIVVNAHDYWNFEKVWDLWFSLPRNDSQITTELWDLILYQWNQITVYYDTNSWNFTRLWKVHGITKSDLWDWDVTLVFSLEN